ncbi:unnamed protein product [Phyllotreta striolata]|uniref:Protein stum n=1 Tax=Phyllotreta striolata TaxID=444603 RepID=A0A9N9XNI1_PHYSR|nr:unnamed protein product [Phyllotreta striolata]
MRPPDNRQLAPPRAGKQFEDELQLHYLSPGAFTVLAPDNRRRPDPPPAPEPYRYTSTTRRNKNQSFAVIADSDTSRPPSRSSSPSGRVSPFKGRGFNPAGSRHASPPPPPEDVRLSPQTLSPKHASKIPQLKRKNSNCAFGEKVHHHDLPPAQKRINKRLSQSLSDIDTDSDRALQQRGRPPPNPTRKPVYNKQPAFQRLSPIVGSSPEPSVTSPSRIPRSRSTPPSRKTSPTRGGAHYRPPPASKTSVLRRSRNRMNTTTSSSRDSSPVKNVASPTRASSRKYKNVQAKVNSFSKPKSKVLPKDQSDESDAPTARQKPPLTRKDSTNRSQSNLLPNTIMPSNNNYTSDSSSSTVVITKNPKPEELVVMKPNTNKPSEVTTESDKITKNTNTPAKIQLPSTTTVVSNTTSTVAQPLKIDARVPQYYEETRAISPMVDGRVLSATSVTHAINKMNDTVLDTQTLMKDSHHLSKLSPAASAIISMANESKPEQPEGKFTTTALPKVEPVHKPVNHVVHVMSSRQLEEEIQKHMHKSADLTKPVNDRVKEARTVVASDVKPIRITVREKPSDDGVQSGNVRVANGLGSNDRPGLPPTQDTPPNEPEKEEETPPKNACSRFFAGCKSKMCAGCASKKPPAAAKPKTDISCLSCFKKKPESTSIVIEETDDKKPGFLQRLNCFKKQKIGDVSSCFPTGKRKGSWVERAGSLSQPARKKCSKQCCKNFLRTIFCVTLCASCCKCCKKKPVEVPERKDSIISKKKSLTPTTAPPPEEVPKIDLSLVEHSSHMKGAIPILPICLAWFCLVMNCIAPGTGTVISGLLCLCIGIPRFSQKDGPKSRIGAFIIDLIIGFSQFFTVLFCLVGWGWSIWWGIIMVKISKKHKRFKQLEAFEQASSVPGTTPNPRQRDPERR